MGAGKTSVGRALARRLNWLFEDLDDRIERRESRTVAEIFRQGGEAEFRRAEHDAIEEVLEEVRRRTWGRIIALGGGAFAQPAVAAMIQKSGVATLFLDAPLEDLWQRCEQQAREQQIERPLMTSKDRFAALYQARRPMYLRARRRVETGGRSVETIAEEIAGILDDL